MRTIVVPVDLSHRSLAPVLAADALELARQRGARLVFMTVLSHIPEYVLAEVPGGLIERNRAEAEGKLQRAVGDLPEDVEVAYRVCEGNAAHEVIGLANATNADLIVIGSRDPSGGTHFFGSTAANVVRRAHCSVHVVRGRPGEGRGAI